MVHIENLNYVNHVAMCLFFTCLNIRWQSILLAGGLILKFLEKMTHTVTLGLEVEQVVLVGFDFNVNR